MAGWGRMQSSAHPTARPEQISATRCHLPFVQHLRLVQLDAAGTTVCRMIGARYQARRHRRAMLRPATARIVLVQVVGERVPAATDAHHDVRAQNLRESREG